MTPEPNSKLQFKFAYDGEVGIDAQYRVKNAHPDEVHRLVLYQQNDFGFSFSGFIRDILHGYAVDTTPGLPSEISVPASLIVFEFQLLRLVASATDMKFDRRVKHIVISLTFDYVDAASQTGGQYPEIIRIDPLGSVYTDSTPTLTESRRGMRLQNPNIGGFTTTRTTTVEQTAHARLKGMLGWGGDRLWGPMNTVQWIAEENRYAKSGVPKNMRVAVLVKRSASQEKFTVTTNIKAHVDNLYHLQRWISKPEADDPVTFDPQKPWGCMDEERRTILENLSVYMDRNCLSKFGVGSYSISEGQTSS